VPYRSSTARAMSSGERFMGRCLPLRTETRPLLLWMGVVCPQVL
jgi:hypothetical protein